MHQVEAPTTSDRPSTDHVHAAELLVDLWLAGGSGDVEVDDAGSTLTDVLSVEDAARRDLEGRIAAALASAEADGPRRVIGRLRLVLENIIEDATRLGADPYTMLRLVADDARAALRDGGRVSE